MSAPGRQVPVIAVGEVAADALHDARTQLAGRLTLADVLEWCGSTSPARRVSEIVTQDEYTHDVVIPFDGSHFLAFDAT